MASYYKLLGISSTADSQQILDGYKKAANKYVRTYSPGDILDGMIATIDLAKETLLDPSRRKEYDLNLTTNGNSSLILHSDREITNYAKFRVSSKKNWKEITSYDGSNHVQALKSLLDATLYLPYSDVQLPVLLCQLLAPSAMCDTLPLGFCYGLEGSGKSLICKIAAKFWGREALASSSSAVSMRNDIGEQKFIQWKGLDIEQNAFIVINDFMLSQLKSNPTLLALLKAYNRDEANIQISSPENNGTNLAFNVYCNRLISSIVPFFGMDEFRELARRMNVFYCEKATSEHNLMPLVDIDLTGFNQLFNLIWNETACYKFAEVQLRQAYNNVKSPVPIDRFDTVRAVYETGVTLGIFADETHAVNHMVQFENLQQELKINFGDKLKVLLKEFMFNRMQEKPRLGLSATVTPLEIKSYAAVCFREGKIDDMPKMAKLNNYLIQLGYSYSNKYQHWS